MGVLGLPVQRLFRLQRRTLLVCAIYAEREMFFGCWGRLCKLVLNHRPPLFYATDLGVTERFERYDYNQAGIR